MTSTPSSGPRPWDAADYDSSFSFVTSYGAPLLELLEPRSGERVLDVGCGTGHQAAQIAGVGADVVGVDSDAAMLDVARRDHPDVRFVRADAQDATALSNLAEGSPFDGVLSNAALHWMPSQDAVLGAIAGVLRPGGRLVVEMGGVGNVDAITRAIRSARADIGLDPAVASSWTFPTPGEQTSRLERNGFTVRLVQLLDRPTPLAVGSSGADWARMFGAALVDDVPTVSRLHFDHSVDSHARDHGLGARPDGEPGWWVDYVRLRFVAVRRTG